MTDVQILELILPRVKRKCHGRQIDHTESPYEAIVTHPNAAAWKTLETDGDVEEDIGTGVGQSHRHKMGDAIAEARAITEARAQHHKPNRPFPGQEPEEGPRYKGKKGVVRSRVPSEDKNASSQPAGPPKPFPKPFKKDQVKPVETPRPDPPRPSKAEIKRLNKLKESSHPVQAPVKKPVEPPKPVEPQKPFPKFAAKKQSALQSVSQSFARQQTMLSGATTKLAAANDFMSALQAQKPQTSYNASQASYTSPKAAPSPQKAMPPTQNPQKASRPQQKPLASSQPSQPLSTAGRQTSPMRPISTYPQPNSMEARRASTVPTPNFMDDFEHPTLSIPVLAFSSDIELPQNGEIDLLENPTPTMPEEKRQDPQSRLAASFERMKLQESAMQDITETTAVRMNGN